MVFRLSFSCARLRMPFGSAALSHISASVTPLGCKVRLQDFGTHEIKERAPSLGPFLCQGFRFAVTPPTFGPGFPPPSLDSLFGSASLPRLPAPRA